MMFYADVVATHAGPALRFAKDGKVLFVLKVRGKYWIVDAAKVRRTIHPRVHPSRFIVNLLSALCDVLNRERVKGAVDPSNDRKMWAAQFAIRTLRDELDLLIHRPA